MRRFAIACAVALVAVGVSSVPARAAAPRDQGWWTVTTPGPTPLPAQLPAQPPGPPDVPARGLLVQAGAGAAMPSAYAALLYELDPGTTAGKLTLVVAPSSVTTPMATLQLCQLLQPINHPEQGGPIADAPPFNCGKSAKAAPSADGKTYSFDASALVSDNLLAVALLPTGPTDRVVFSAPDDSSLTTQAGDASGGAAPSDSGAIAAPSDTTPAPVDTTGLATGAATSPSLADSLPGAAATGPSSVAPSPAAAPPRSSGDTGVFVPTVSTGAEKATPILVILFIVLGFAGTVLWLFAGRQHSTSVVIG